jgi:hypothetical protein
MPLLTRVPSASTGWLGPTGGGHTRPRWIYTVTGGPPPRGWQTGTSPGGRLAPPRLSGSGDRTLATRNRVLVLLATVNQSFGPVSWYERTDSSSGRTTARLSNIPGPTCPVRPQVPALRDHVPEATLSQSAPIPQVAKAPVAQEPLGAFARPDPPGARHAAPKGSQLEHRLPSRAVVHLPVRQDDGKRDPARGRSARARPARVRRCSASGGCRRSPCGGPASRQGSAARRPPSPRRARHAVPRTLSPVPCQADTRGVRFPIIGALHGGDCG